MAFRTLPLLLLPLFALPAADFESRWTANTSRVWPGPEYWSNPLQDWRIRNGRLECIAPGGDRNVYLLTRDVGAAAGTLEMSVRLGRLDPRAKMGPGFAGFRVGIRGAFRDYRDSAVRGDGLDAGVAADGRLFIGKLGQDAPKIGALDDIELRFGARPAGAVYTLTLAAYGAGGAKLGEVVRQDVPAKWLTGGLALVCHSGPVQESPQSDQAVRESGWADKRGTQRGGSVTMWYRDWKVSGTKVTAHEDRIFGPVLWAMHTLSRRVLKLTAQMAPCDDGPREVELLTRAGPNAAWKPAAKASIDAMARTATFRIGNWDDSKDTPYRVRYQYEGREYTFDGTIRRDPRDKPRITVAAFTGNNDLGFPHADIVRHVKFFRPDFLAYTGDNIYERVGEYGIQREPVPVATLDYLRKWYLFGWEYRELLKDTPAVCLPDDHDVYHGNIWGAGGRRAEGFGQEGQDKGGYTMPAEWVNMVQRTQTSHMADPYDPTPVAQGISVYYGPMVYGGISFAVIEDRKWKSAPREFLPDAKIVNGWPQSPAYNAARDGDAPGAQLLGARQEEFLNKWAHDWSGGAWMKAVISQTIFANVATLPKEERSDGNTGRLRVMKPGEYAEGDAPVMDHDSNGWPQTPRNKALRAMRKGFAFHIAGDQHLGSTIQYGIDEWNDAGWAICVPSVANVFPRRWFPPEPGRNRKPGAPRNTGEYLDGFGNKMTVHAVSNPTTVDVEPTALHQRAPGFGIVTFDKTTRKIGIANWPRWVDPAKPGAKPYAGWPVTIDQLDNGFPKNGPALPAVSGQAPDPVVQVIDEANNEILYTVRVRGARFTPRVWKPGSYTVKVFDPDKGYEKTLRNQQAK